MLKGYRSEVYHNTDPIETVTVKAIQSKQFKISRFGSNHYRGVGSQSAFHSMVNAL